MPCASVSQIHSSVPLDDRPKPLLARAQRLLGVAHPFLRGLEVGVGYGSDERQAGHEDAPESHGPVQLMPIDGPERGVLVVWLSRGELRCRHARYSASPQWRRP